MSTSTDNLPPDHGYMVEDPAIAFIVVVTVATILRVWARHIQKTPWMAGDIFIPLSMLFNLGTCTASLLAVRYGAGKPMSTLSEDDLVSFQKTVWIGGPICYVFAVTWPKLAVLDLYLKIFPDKPSRWACYGCGVILVLSLIINACLVIGQCRPIQKVWDRERSGWCDNTNAEYTWGSLPNVITDFVMLILPIPTIIKLQQRWQVKFGIMLNFLCGSAGQVFSIVRIYYFYRAGLNTSSTDPTYQVTTVIIWTIVEPGTYHLAACSLTYRSLFSWMTKSIRQWLPSRQSATKGPRKSEFFTFGSSSADEQKSVPTSSAGDQLSAASSRTETGDPYHLP